MTSKQFLVYVATGILSLAVLVIPFNMTIDTYGLYRPAGTRRLYVFGEERVAKYLHSFRYIRENFDGVLLGSSTSAILETKQIKGYRIYNASIVGGNVEDLKPIAQNIFADHRVKVSLICVHRYLTNDHAQKTDLITPKQYWSALASPQLLTAYLSRIAVALGLIGRRYDEYGTQYLQSEPDSETVQRNIADTVREIQAATVSTGNYYIDPVAFSDLRTLISLARRNSQQLVIYFPPVPAPVLAVRASEYNSYRRSMDTLLEPGDIVVDFNTPAYAGLRQDLHNFVDGSHLSRAGARIVLEELATTLAQTNIRNQAITAAKTRFSETQSLTVR